MTADAIRVIRWALESEIEAVDIDLKKRRASSDTDVRLTHLRLLRATLAEVLALRP